MGDTLKIKIGADVAEGLAGVKQFNAALNTISSTAQKAAGGADTITAAFQKIASVDFSQRIADATARINAGIDTAADAALKMGNGFEKGVDMSIKSINQLENELEDLDKKISQATSIEDIRRLNAEFKKTEQQLKNLRAVAGIAPQFDRVGSSARNASTGIGTLRPASAQATNAVTNFSRVIQDAPYGIIGIANNIEQLAVSFTQLRATTSTSGQAVKLFLSSLTGGGGLILGISLITSALSFASMGFSAWTRGIGDSGKASKKAKEDVEEYAETLKSVGQEVATEATKITKLFAALQSGDLNVKQRKKALEELQQANVEFFGSLKEENGIIVGLQNAYDGYLQRLLQIGRAKAVESQITKLFDKKLQLELTIDPKFNAAIDPRIQQQIGTFQKRLKLLGGEVNFEETKGLNIYGKGNEKLLERVTLTRQIADLQQGSAFFADENLRKTQQEIKNIDLQIAGLTKLQQLTGNFDIREDKDNKGKTEEEKVADSLRKQIQALELLKKSAGLTNSEFEKLLDLKRQLFTIEAAKNGLSGEQIDRFVGAEIMKERIDDLKDQIRKLEELKKLGGLITKDEFLLADLKVSLAIAENSLQADLSPEQLQRKIDEIIDNADTRANIPAVIDLTKVSVDGKLQSTVQGFVKSEELKNINKAISAGIGKINPTIQAPTFSNVTKIIEDAGLIAAAFAKIQDTATKLENILVNSLGSAFTEFFSNVASEGQNAFKQFGQAILGVVKKLIAAAITAAIFAAIIGAATGGASFGGGSSSFVGGFKSLFSQLGGLKLARGGITTGPTLAMIGDNPSGKEAVIPFERMGEFLRNVDGGGGYIAETRISGDELRILLQRAERRNGKIS